MKKIVTIFKILIVFCITYIYIYSRNNFFIIIISWGINIVIIKKVQLLQSEKYEFILGILRRTLYLLPLIIPLVLKKELLTISDFKINFLYLLESILIGIMFLLPHLKKYFLYFNSDFIVFLEKKKKYDVISNIYSLLGGAILEEIYFRKFIIDLSKGSLGTFSIIFSSILFFFQHYSTNKQEKFSTLDFVNQIIFGLVIGSIYYYQEYLMIAVITHVVYNIPLVILDIKLLEKRRNNEQ